MSDLMLNFAAACQTKGIPILPSWYKYLDGTNDSTGRCAPAFTFPNDLNLIALAVVEILLRLGVYVAVGFLIYGSFLYITSRGEPDKAAAAKQTIFNAVIGLIVGLVATGAINFIGTRLAG